MLDRPVILVDGSSYFYRAFHALPSLTNSKGMATGAIYGMTNMLQRLLTEYQPEYASVIFDSPGKTVRHTWYPHYKANRPPMPDELVQQIEPLQRIIHALGLPLTVIEGIEADDIIGTLALAAAKLGWPVLIATSDKDFMQLLVHQHITLINTMTNTTLDKTGVSVKLGITPQQVTDYLALVGDKVDNIPGVEGVGPVTAAKWLKQYGSLEQLMLHAADITGKIGHHLRTALSWLPQAKQLVTIQCQLALPIKIEDLRLKPIDEHALCSLYTELEFKSLLAKLAKTAPTVIALSKTQATPPYDTITTAVQFDQWLTLLNEAEYVAIDTETSSLDYHQAKLIGLSFAITPGKAAYLPLNHDYPDAPPQLDLSTVLNQLHPILAHKKIIGQNLKYDLQILANYAFTLYGPYYDTMLAAYVLDSTNKHHDLDSLAYKHLQHHTLTWDQLTTSHGKPIQSFSDVPIAMATHYAAEDADIALQLHQHLWPQVQALPGIKTVLEEIENPLIPVLAQMERHGVLLDATQLLQYDHTLTEQLQSLAKDIFTLCGCSFNLNSPKQLQSILFNKLQLPTLAKTASGQPSTADSVLQELAIEFEIPRLIIHYRALAKLQSTYTSRLVAQINRVTGRLHTSYHQAGTATGRLSSARPNLQNIPTRTLEGRRIRQAFIAPAQHQLICADYSQIELRLMAHMSMDETLLSAFAHNQDIHQATAAEIWALPLEQVTAELRRQAKVINFGLIYGMSAFGLARQLGISYQAADEYICRYFARYPQVKLYMQTMRTTAHQQGYVETIFGRRLYLPDINSSREVQRKAAERTAINAPLQGSAADIIKLVMIKLHDWLTTNTIPAKMIMQVHDELIFEVADTACQEVVEHITTQMTSIVTLQVPLQVAIGIGRNWDAASAH